MTRTPDDPSTPLSGNPLPASFYAQPTLRVARALLESGQRPIGEIATSLGYAETAAFSRAFRHRFGQGPRAARRQASTAPAVVAGSTGDTPDPSRPGS